MSPRPRKAIPWAVVSRMVTLTVEALEAVCETEVIDPVELSRDPLTVLEAWGEVTVRRLPRTDSALAPAGVEACSVAGTYYDGTGSSLPIIAVAQSMSPGRDAFTALHELGHHLQRTRGALANQLAELDVEVSFIVEDEVCNRFAAAVLIPADVAAEVFGDGTPTAGNVVELTNRTSASRSAVCVRASQHLKTTGLVVLLDPEDNVQFASRGNLPPPRRGSSQGTRTLVKRARARLAEGVTDFRLTDDEFQFLYRDQIEGEHLFAQIADIGDDYLVIVAVDSKPPWSDTFTAPRYRTGLQAKSRICPHEGCGEEFTSWTPVHEVCGEPECPACNRCACTLSHVQERTCGKCFTVQPAQLFPGEDDICEECAS